MSITLPASSKKYTELVALAVRLCHDAKVMDFNGHCSQRDESDPNVMYVNNRYASRATVVPADVVPYDIERGKRIGDGVDPPSEHWIHREIYLRRPDVKGIVHSHPENVLALSCAGHTLKPIMLVGAFLPQAGAPVFDSPVLINTEARGRAVAETLGNGQIVVLRQHGTVTCGGSLEEAVTLMCCAEQNAEMQERAIAMGGAKYLQGSEFETLHGEQIAYAHHAVEKQWTYMIESAERNGALAGLRP